MKKKWTNNEVTALTESVAELGYSAGIRAFIASDENINSRTFAACEYALNKQKKQQTVAISAVLDVEARNVVTEVKPEPEEKKPGFWKRIINFIFCTK